MALRAADNPNYRAIAGFNLDQKLGFSTERNDDWCCAMRGFGECRLILDQSINVHPDAAARRSAGRD